MCGCAPFYERCQWWGFLVLALLSQRFFWSNPDFTLGGEGHRKLLRFFRWRG
jgi:hypothetical protein